jgi:hypothetical protein
MSPVVLPPTPPNPKTGEGAGLAEGVPNAKGVVFSGALGVLGAPNVKGAGLLLAFFSLSGAPKAKGVGLAGFASVLLDLEPAPKVN